MRTILPKENRTLPSSHSWLLWLSLALSMTAVAGAILAIRDDTSLFLYFRLARVAYYWESGRIGTASLGNVAGSSFEMRLGTDFILMMLGKITGLSLSQLTHLAIGSLIMPIMYFSIAKKLSESNVIATLLAIYIGFNHSMIANQYNVFIYTWMHALVLATIILLLKIATVRKARRDVILLLILFMATFLSYHSTSAWIVVIVIIFSAVLLLPTIISPKKQVVFNFDSFYNKNSRKSLSSIALAFVVIYLYFDPVFYRIYLPELTKMNDSRISNALEPLYERLMAVFGTVELTALPPYQQVVITSPLAGVLSIVVVVMITLPILVDGVLVLHDLLWHRNVKLLTPLRALWVSLLVATVFHSFTYASYLSGLSFKLVHLLLPFCTIFSWRLLLERRKLENNQITIIYMALLVMATIIGFSQYASYQTTQAAPQNLGSIITKMSDLDSDSIVILTGVNTYSRFLLQGIEQGKLFDFQDIDSVMYSLISGRITRAGLEEIQTECAESYNGESQQLEKYLPELSCQDLITYYGTRDFDYLVIDSQHLTKPLWGMRWDTYDPFSNHINEIDFNPHLFKVFDNGQIIVYQNVAE
jgi:hypothetical protein